MVQANSCEEPRIENGVLVFGPGLFAKDDRGTPLSPIGMVFPAFRALWTGRGIHAMQAGAFLDYLREKRRREDGGDLSGEEEETILESAVALLVRGQTVLIRSDPSHMERMAAADELLQRVVPKTAIQFTGVDLEGVRKELRARGESWRISPPPRSEQEIAALICASLVHVGTGATYYHNTPTGARFLTCEEFVRIWALLRTDQGEALARLREILALTRLYNSHGVPELSFFLPAAATLETDLLETLVAACAHAQTENDWRDARGLYDDFARMFAQAAGPELRADDMANKTWRTTMFCRLCDIKERSLEELVLGLSREFLLNVAWEPGARIVAQQLVFEPMAERPVRDLITYFWRARDNLRYINVGRVMASQAERDITSETREVRLVLTGCDGDREELYVVRRAKWDVRHRVARGASLDQAIAETEQYRNYILDRLRAARELGVPLPRFEDIRLEEDMPGMGAVPVVCFCRPYVYGIATDKITEAHYRSADFVKRLAFHLGQAAAMSLALGRADARTHGVFFDDGDEIIEFDANDLPCGVVIADTTGAFTDWSTPLKDALPHCVWHFAKHLARARDCGLGPDTFEEAIREFTRGVLGELEELQRVRDARGDRLYALFKNRGCEPGGVRARWESLLERLRMTRPQDLRDIIDRSPDLEPFRARPAPQAAP